MNAKFQVDSRIVKIAEAYALDAIDTAQSNFSTVLDWSEISVREVEKMLGELHDQMAGARPSDETIWTFAKMFGSYVGEILRRHHGAEWGLVNMGGESLPGLHQPGGGLCWPWSRARKRLVNGPENNIWHYYSALVEEKS